MVHPTHIVAAAGFVTNQDGAVLLIRNPTRGWECPGGQVEMGESLIGAVVREILEETGVLVEVQDMVGVYSNISDPVKVIFGFICEYLEGELTPSDESPEVEWVDPAEVLERVTHPAVHDRVRDMLNYDGRVMYRVYQMNPYRSLQEIFVTR